MGISPSKAQEKSLFKEVFVGCPMTPQQNASCKSVFLENKESLIKHQNIKEIARKSLEACNHPFLIKKEFKNGSIDDSINNFDLIKFSGKMILLDKLLSNTNKRNKVIIVSQMNRMLDILDSYLIMKGYKFSKLSSSIRGQQRQDSIDSFINEKNNFYILLLNTKSGVRGINLTSANTIIVFDGEINMMNEFNFGNPVIYYLISDKSSEQMMFKLRIENSKRDYEKILRYGAYYTFRNQEEKLKNEVDELIIKDIGIIINSATRNNLFEINENSLNLNISNFWEHLHEEQNYSQPKKINNNYFNPECKFYSNISKEELFVDKSKMINIINEKFLEKSKRYLCVSRPRRFGKSYIAQMLCAYYSKGSDYKELFGSLKLARKSSSWLENINKYNVIFMDIMEMLCDEKPENYDIYNIQSLVLNEIKISYPTINFENDLLSSALKKIYKYTSEKFIIIIDEWDYILNNCQDNQKLINDYIIFIGSMFKGIQTTNYISLAYITGILPIKCYNLLSTTNNFFECTMLNSYPFDKFFGFTEKEVKKLCLDKEPDFNSIEKWYDGYILNGIHIYNPNSVIISLLSRKCQSYWSRTGNYEILGKYINLNFDGLQDAFIELLSDNRYSLLPIQYKASINEFVNKEDVLIYLVHIGYLAYDSRTEEAFIPNMELFYEFDYSIRTIKSSNWKNVKNALEKSSKLLDDTLNGRSKEVAEGIEQIHTENVAILSYKNELSLSCVLSLAYFSSIAYYSIVREFLLGKGFADLTFLPKKNVNKPALIVELRWNKSSNTAIKQIESNKYHGSLSKITDGDILLVDINYDKKSKIHTCEIRKYNCTDKTISSF